MGVKRIRIDFYDDSGCRHTISLQGPITRDKAGDLFVSDIGNRTIRKIVIATQEVTTVVGTPDRRYGWVLARTPQLAPDQQLEIEGILRAQGYDPDRFQPSAP